MCIVRMDLAVLYTVFIYQCLIVTHRYSVFEILDFKLRHLHTHKNVKQMKLFCCLYKIFSFHPYLRIFLFMPGSNAWDCFKMDVLLDFVCTSICTMIFFIVIAHVCFCQFVGFVFSPKHVPSQFLVSSN
jgi:hypothetical protein